MTMANTTIEIIWKVVICALFSRLAGAGGAPRRRSCRGLRTCQVRQGLREPLGCRERRVCLERRGPLALRGLRELQERLAPPLRERGSRWWLV
ncbi:hypothetical protein K270103H11_08980 [Gordonibacter urolithinfaciens]